MSVKMRQEVERKIARAFVKQAIEKGYLLSVYNGGEDPEIEDSGDIDKVMASMMLADDDKVMLYDQNRQYVGWVWFVYGNDGWDVISDYTTNLDKLGLMTEAEKVAKHYEP